MIKNGRISFMFVLRLVVGTRGAPYFDVCPPPLRIDFLFHENHTNVFYVHFTPLVEDLFFMTHPMILISADTPPPCVLINQLLHPHPNVISFKIQNLTKGASKTIKS